ncbi:U3 small nucleolar ribonucleoprotein protein MPP10-like [Dendronephthya gigantea]|uniref:U3 small nucleolar ribonucleoprotein protein MPP10-like n=1 Tax=Dendronephthya gigantea TaxID=151771 RepID=UPI00106D66AE|nr:U3 small nucleolar ribonucleoprotein protein MPP10-like [Dendronephthya gigantea]
MEFVQRINLLIQEIKTGFKRLLKKEIYLHLNDEECSRSKESDVITLDKNEIPADLAESSSCGNNHADSLLEENTDEEMAKSIEKRSKPKKTSFKGSIVDDQFFKLAEMERFLESKHARDDASSDGSDDDENIDYFTDLNKGDGTSNFVEKNVSQSVMYSDYFDIPDDLTEEKIGNDQKSDESVDDDFQDKDSSDYEETEEISSALVLPDDDIGTKSTLEKQQERVKKQITALEDSNVAAKSWQLTGEISASARPSNSLLEEVLQFDHTTAGAPVITEETSKTLEEIIIQRIKDGAWDDVERKQKPVKEPYEYKKPQPLNQEKSKMSLSEIYEKEYLQQQNPEVEQENEEHQEIEKLMKSLFSKLDALTNFHFTPKPLKSEVNIVSNVPSISIEECTPVNVSETALLAPEEIFDKQKTEVKSQGEMTKQDRNRERRGKKRKQRFAAKEKAKLQKVIEKTNPGLGNKYGKAKALESLKKDKSSTIVDEKKRDSSLTSSSGFFTQLQDSVKEEIHKKTQNGKKKKKNETTSAHCRL